MMELRPVGVGGVLAVLGNAIRSETGAQVAALREAVEHLLDDGRHVVILVFRQAATEDDVFLAVGLGLVFGVERGVLLVVYGVIGLHAVLPFHGVFSGDDGRGAVVDLLAEHLEVLVLYDAGVGHFALGIVHHGVALIVGRVKCLLLKADSAVF